MKDNRMRSSTERMRLDFFEISFAFLNPTRVRFEKNFYTHLLGNSTYMSIIFGILLSLFVFTVIVFFHEL